MMMAATSEGKNSTHLVWPLPLDEISEPEFPWHASDYALKHFLGMISFLSAATDISSLFSSHLYSKKTMA